MPNYATTKNPNGKYKNGTIIKITGRKIKVANGTFKITSLFGPQPKSDDAYFLYTRILNNGKLSTNKKTGLRGNWGSSLDKIAKIIKKT